MGKVAVTGATGFIGSHLTGHLHRSGFPFSTLKRTEDNFIYPADWEECNSIVHLAAAAHRKKSRKTNLSYTLNLAEKAACSNVRHFIFVSSVGVLGEFSGDAPFDADSPYNPYDAYTVSKMEAERGLRQAFQNTGVNLTIIRPPLVYGSGARGRFSTLSTLVRKTPVLPLASTASQRSFCSVNNLCDLIITCLGSTASHNRTFLVSDGATVTVLELIKMMYKGLDKTGLAVPVPVPLVRLAGLITGKTRAVNKMIGTLTLDISHTMETLNWRPPYAMEQEIGIALKDG